MIWHNYWILRYLPEWANDGDNSDRELLVARRSSSVEPIDHFERFVAEELHWAPATFACSSVVQHGSIKS